MRSYLGSKKSKKAHNLVGHATSSTKLQHRLHRSDSPQSTDKADNRRRNSGRRGGNANSNGASGSSSMVSSPQTTSKTSPVPTVMPIRNQQPARTRQSFSPPISMKTICVAPFCRFYLATNNQTMQCPAISPHIRAKLINTREANFPTLWRRPRGSVPSGYQGCFPQQGGSLTASTQQASAATNNQPAPQQANQPAN